MNDWSDWERKAREDFGEEPLDFTAIEAYAKRARLPWLMTLVRRVRQLEAERQPHPIDLIVQLREALGLFAGAMSVTPKAAWGEAIAMAKALADGKCGECERRALGGVA